MAKQKSLEVNKKMYQAYVELRKNHPVKEIEFMMPESKKVAKK